MTRYDWAPYTEDDYLWVVALHVEQETKLGRKMDLPNLSERPVVAAYVGRINGRIEACVFFEAELELCAMAHHPLSKEDVQNVTDDLMEVAQFYKIRIVRSFVPVQAAQAVKKILDHAGFDESDETMTNFYRWIPQREG